MQEAFICAGLRSPIGRFGGSLSGIRPDDLLAHVISALMASHPALPPEAVDEVVIGCANQAGEDNRNIARMSALLAGLPDSVPGTTVNRLCGSGLDAVSIAARTVKTGEADLVIAGGAESMSRAPLVMSKSTCAFDRGQTLEDTTIGWRFVNPRMQAAHGTESMPETAENVAEDHAISRADQDAFALRSQQRAVQAIASGRMRREITPIPVPQRRGDRAQFDTDEHPRTTTLEKLAALPAPFRKGGSVTAGNASGVNDGAAALIVASEAAVKRHGLTPLARVIGAATAGVAPRIMGIGPVAATERLLARTGHTSTDLGVIELNEAFASQALATLRALGLPDDAEQVNPNGGAIALGHPLGMSGARLALTASLEIAQQGHSLGLCTMCIGVGQGISMLLGGV